MQSEVVEGYRLSPIQQRLWSLQAATGVVYRCQGVLRVHGDLDRASLSVALARVVERNEILRTAFSLLPGMSWPLQVIREARLPIIEELDLRSCDAEAVREAIDGLLASAAHREFDLAGGDVLRVSLVRLGEREHALLLSLPSLCADAATLCNITAEIARACSAERGQGEQLEPPLQYADVAEWHNQLLDSPDSAEGIERWRELWRERRITDGLAGRVPLEESLGSGPFEPAAVPVPLDSRSASRIEDLLRAWDTPAPAFFLACWKILLWRTTGQSDVVVGALLDGRSYEELQGAMGPLAAYLPIHGRLDEEMRPREVTLRVRESLEAAKAAQDCFSWQHLDGRATASGEPPFFPFCFSVEEPWEDTVSGLRLALARQEGILDRFHLELVCSFIPGVFRLELRYDSRRFRRDVAELLAERLSVLLESVAEQPEAPLAEAGCLGERELRRVLAELSHGPKEATPIDLRIHRLFEEQAQRTPYRPAVISDEESLTYFELNARANRLARHLRTFGIGPEIPVGICLPRSAASVAAILGVLKAGGFWVPLDPSLPVDRLEYILRDTAAPVLLSRGRLLDELLRHENFPGALVVLLDAQAEEIGLQSSSNLEEDGPPGALAYTIYTSGSTGQPKGVMVEHGSPINLLQGLQRAILEPVTRSQPLRASLNAPLAFDASVQQLVLLLAGHTLCVIPDEVRTNGAALLDYLAERELDLFDCTPSQLRLLLAAGLLDRRNAVPELFLVAGEAIDPGMWESLRRSDRTVFHNIYGPTECTVDATSHRIAETDGGPTIGRPLQGYEIYLLDRGLRPVPFGVPGEICVGGAGLARGYVGRSDLTAERFVPHPFSATGARLYRTGDLARYRADGSLEFLGRVDHQVKIRGYRIELGEIEAVLARHPWVKKAVVVVRLDDPDQPTLVAYFSPSTVAPTGLAGAHGELHRFLRERLPVYMVPVAFVAIEAFPLTSNGKVDRRALPAPDRARPDRGGSQVGPRNPREEILALIWRETLRLEAVGVEDNFFELGGDSILSIQVISRAALAGLRLTARQIFEHQTIARLAAVAEAVSPVDAESGTVMGEVPLTPIQAGFFEQNLSHPEHFNQAVLLQAAERISMVPLRGALNQLLRHHDALRMRFEPPSSGCAWKQINLGETPEPPLVAIDLSALPEDRWRSVLETAAAQIQSSLNLSRGPLLRVALFHLGAAISDRLLILVHHLVVDGVSWRILLEDLETSYRQLARGEEISLPPKTSSFRRWAEQLAGHAKATELDGDFWLRRLGRVPGALPRDRQDGTNNVASTRIVRVALEAEETRELLQDVPRAYRTRIDDVLLTALMEAVAGWSGSRRVLVDLEGHGREELFPDLSVVRTVGWFTTVYPVLLDGEGAVPPGEALKAIKEQLRAIPDRGIGYGLLRHLGSGGAAEALRSAPRAELIFNYLGQFDTASPEDRLLRLAPESAGPTRGSRQLRSHLLEVDGSVVGGRLRLNWTYSENLHRQDTVETVAQRFLLALRALIDHCRSRETTDYTPSDFPLARLDLRALDGILARVPGEIEDLYPLSPLQQGMLFHSIDAATGVYFRQWSFTLQGNLDIGAFQRACQTTVDRHTILRTLFLWEGLREPLQLVLRQTSLPMKVVDLRGLPEAEKEAWVAELRRADRTRGFDLGVAPLMRLTFVRLAEETWLLVWSFHHLVLDGWSFPLLISEVFSLYRDLRQSELRETKRPRPFREYLEWLQRQDLAAAEGFWRRELAGFTTATPLATDGEPGVLGIEAGEERLQVLLPEETTALLQSWARRHQLTLNTVVQGAWALLLARYGGQSDVAFGAVSSGRTTALPGMEAMLGVFINTLPVRVEATPRAPLLGWLRSLQERQATVREYEFSPLAQVQGWSEIPRGRPLFQSLLIFENYPVDDSVQGEGGSLRISEAELPESTNYPLCLVAAPGPQLLLRLIWERGVFERVTMERRLRHLLTALEAFLVHGGSLAEIPILSEVERHQVLREWNDTAAGDREPPLVHGSFEQRAADYPEAVAIRFQDEELSYGELDRRANQVAHHLRRRGVAPGTLVGLSLERSIDLVVGLLGIWKAGAGFVPLDPSYPEERRAFLVEDSGLTVVLSRERWPEVFSEDDAELPSGAEPASPAYVIYTSGSTGRPKGVLVEHRQLSNLLSVCARELGWGSDDAMPCLAAFSFDIFLFELLNPLLSGGTCELVSITPSVDVPALARRLPSWTRLHAVPAVMRQLVEEVRQSGVSSPGLRTLFVGGEAVPADLLAAMRTVFPSAEIRVLYGPTEATVIVTSWAIRPGERPARSLIGRPLGNMEVRLCDPQGLPVPLGAVGEIWIGGRGVARGYLGREELTRERYPLIEGQRFYRTGDLARQLTSGELEFLGRIDQQVKIRGFRVEPGEVEAALAEFPGVLEAAVSVREDLPGGAGLVGFLVPEPGAAVEPAAIWAQLRRRLPAYMVPARLVVQESLPLTAHGKLDRKALMYQPLAPENMADRVGPRTPVEALLAEIFADVLGLDQTGIHDDFFALGGHSLLATQVVSRVRAAFRLELPLRSLFEAPTVATLGVEVEARLSGGGLRQVPPIVRVPRSRSEERALPLSFSQERLWFLDQLEPGSATYNIPLALGLRGALSWAALAASLTYLTARHEALRAAFPTIEGRPQLRIADALQVEPLIVDLRHLPPLIRSAEVARLTADEARRPFDLARGPLLRSLLLHSEDDLHVALLTLHHIISDGWSMGVLVREFGELYTAFREGRAATLSTLPVQYADFAAWQRAWLSGEVLDQHLAWWRERLAGAPPVLELPFDRPRPAVQRFRAAQVPIHLPVNLARDLLGLARAHGATSFIVLLAAFQLLLSRLSAQDDLTVGAPIANRNRQEIEGLIGFFVNTLVLRGSLVGDPSFLEWMARVRETALGAYTHQDLPFEKLVEELRPERTLAHAPLFQVMLVLQNAPVSGLALPGLAVEPVGAVGREDGTNKFDITLSLAESPWGIGGSWRYNSDLFDESTARRITSELESLLAGIAARPESRLSEIPWLSEGERHQLLLEWNDTAEPLEAPGCVHNLVLAQAARTPRAVAVEFEGEVLTYTELTARSLRLAKQLRALGVGPETPVGVAMERSMEMVVALLGIMQAGGAYIPLDPEAPLARTALILDDARPVALLTQSHLALPETFIPRLCLDAGWDGSDAPAVTPAPAGVLPDHLACILYTSGSTGRPKGVLATHRGLVNRLLWAQETYPLEAADRVLQKAPFLFDFSIWELFAPLIAGARAVLAVPGGHRDTAYLARVIAERGITVAHFVPSLLWVFLNEPGLDRCTSLRCVFSGGEALPPEVRDRFFDRFDIELRNQYGPTEASVDVSHWLCRQDDPARAVPIGRPISETRLHVVDRSLRPVPTGVAGELCLGGVGLARGYLGRPDLTAERFIPDPWSPRPGERLYRSGDQAKRRPGGEIEYLGRTDDQLKIRGVRIEPGEIEASLASCPGVREAAVGLVGEKTRPQLAAWVVAVEGGLDSGAMRRFLESRFPVAMIPAVFVPLHSLPRTPSGKLDRRALPSPEPAHRSGRGQEAPRNAKEGLLARIWAEVLRLPEVGIHDNFFELGGDSILSIQVVARAARAGCRITPRQVFEHQTIAALAVVADTGAAVQAEQGPITGPVLLTPIQRRFLESGPIEPHHFNQSVLLSGRSAVSPQVAERALSALACHHDALRLRFAPAEEGWTAWNAAPEEAPPAWQRVDLSALEAARAAAELSALADPIQSSLDLSGPLVRGVWFDLPGGQTRLLLLVHHLVVDGVSWRVLLEDLETACRQLGRGETVSLPPKTTPFQAWAKRLSGHALALPLEPERSWWLAESAPGTARLPLDDPDGEDTEASTAWVGMTLSIEETQALLQEVPAAWRTQINDVLLTALALSLGSPGEALAVALEGHGREEIAPDLDLSRTVGWFTTVFPVRLEVAVDAAETLRAVKEHLREVPERGIGYGLLRYLRGELVGLAWPEVSFNYLGQFDQVLAGDALFARASEPTGSPRSPRSRRAHRLDVVAMVAGGRLRVDWGYGGKVLQRATVERIAAHFSERLRELIAACRHVVETRAAVYTPSDFPLAGLNRPALGALLGGEWGIEDVYPLSSVQEGILFHSLYQPASGVYVGQLLCRLRGEVAPQTFAAACRWLVRQHPILRSSFHWRDLVRPLQVVHAAEGAAGAEVEVLDWRAARGPGIEERLAEQVRADRGRGFDPAAAPLMRWTLIRTGEREHHLLWTHHHILLDGWSFSALAAELLDAYAALVRGEEPAAVRRGRYRDYIAWLEGRDLAETEAYWRQALDGWSEPARLPLQSQRDGATASETRRLRLSRVGTEALQAAARRRQLTLNTLAQAAWAVLVSRYAAREDVVFGATLSGRPAELPGVESMVGLFINTLPVRARVVEGNPLLPWLEELQIGGSELRQHEHTPLVRVQEWIGAPRGQALFDSILVFESYPREEALSGGREGSFEIAEVRAFEQTHYPLTVSVTPGDEMSLTLDFDPSRCDEAAAVRFLEHFRSLIEGIAAALEQPAKSRVADLVLLSAAERHQLVVEWNDTEAGPRPPRCVHELFEEQAARAPERPAVISSATGETFSYGELNRRANRVAHHLRALGVAPDAPVGVCLPRSPELIVALLGVLKVGGAYLPLDPEYPPERLDSMLLDAGAEMVLTTATSPFRDRLGARPVRIDDPEIAGRSAADHAPIASAGNLAYVMYTSGSTGRPKGVLVEHRAVATYCLTARRHYRLTPADRVLQFASISFDVSVEEIFPALSCGAGIVLASPEMPSPGRLLASCREHGVTVLSLATAFWHELSLEIARGQAALPPALRLVIFGGEKVLAERVAEWSRCVEARVELLHAYGPTESTVNATLVRIEGAPREGEEVSIGRPIAGATIRVLDRELSPVPVSIAGELCVGGAGLARGYLGRPELTAERFVPDPFAAEPGGRLYRTGDLAHWRPDGLLEFLGRVDRQLKVRGIRIEPGEIEAVLAGHPAVREVTVVAREDATGSGTLAAYVVIEDDASPADLRAFLRERLPAALVPAHLVRLERLPLTPNGKVDRAALPPPEGRDEPASAALPASPFEELLAGILAEVLLRPRVGSTDNFLDLGGHSLLATRVASRVRAVLGVELPLRELFEAPTVAALARRLEELAAVGRSAPPPLVPVARERDLPLSFAQERLWFLDQLHPDSPAYNMPLALGLRGTLPPAGLTAGLTALVARHKSLRTTFRAVNGRPVQDVAPPSLVALPVVDLRSLSLARREAAALALAADEAVRPFDLSRGPLLRAALLRLEDERHVGLFNLHHIVSDGWSMGVLVRELGELFAAWREDRRPDLPVLPVQYPDYAVWQRAWLDGAELERQLAWWREHLGGAPAALDLPFDRSRSPVHRARGAQAGFRLPEDFARRLAALSRERGATVFMVLLAGLQVLLARLSGQDDLVVGSVVANRNRAEVEGLIGFFVNTLALRGRLGEGESFGERIAAARDAALGAYAHQDLPFEKLVEELHPERSLSLSPLFQVLFVLQNTPIEAFELPGIRLEPVPTRVRVSKFDLTLSMAQASEALAGSWEYSTDLFDAATVARLAGSFERLLAAAVADPGRPIAELPLLSETERQQLLEWSAGGSAPLPPCLHEQFELRAALAPDAVALAWSGGSLTFGELDERANRLARHLRSLGVGRETLVGVLLDRSPEQVTALLAVLKAGGAYLPMDPSYPAERLAFILEDAGVAVLLSTRNLLDPLPLPSRLAALAVEEPLPPLPSGTGAEPAGFDPESLAYVIYTSGSTGAPKGTELTHRGLLNLIGWHIAAFEVTEADRCTHVASPAFDASVWEIWPALAAGASLHLPPKEARLDAGALLGWLAAERITVSFLPTPLAEACLTHLEKHGVPEGLALRILLTGGDRLQRAPRPGLPFRLVNNYGPTESTVVATSGHVAPRTSEAPPEIGTPIANTRILVLDGDRRPVAVGVPGEIWIGGLGLARGYLARPALTADRFRPDPFGEEPGSRLYRTGDLARWRSSGALEFLGRTDFQVKLRGLRIELGEIEAVLASHPRVREAAVLAREQRLIGFAVPHDPAAAPTPAELRETLGRQLPDYMVPAAFVLLDFLPLNPNGKVDRRALAALAPEASAAGERESAPRTPSEELLAGLWAEVLGVERLGIHDNFFELGGHSLLATQVASRVRQTFGVDLPLRSLFESPTVARLAAAIEELLRGGCGTETDAPPLVAIPREGELPLSFAQQRLWVFEQLHPGTAAYNVPIAIRAVGDLDAGALRAAFEELAARHETLRTIFRERDGQPVQVITPGLAVELPRVDLAGLPPARREEEVRRALRESARVPFDLSRGPLLKVTLLQLTPAESVLLLVLHHIVADGWSLGVLVRELSEFYRAFTRGEPTRLPELPIQYADFAAWQQSWLRGAELDRLLAWWTLQFSGAPARLELPFARLAAAQRFRGASRSRVVGPALAAELKALGRRESATLFMVLLAGFQALLSIRSGATDLVVGTDIANRNRAETEGLIGFFINQLALRSNLSGNPAFRELLARARETALGAYAHQDLPFERLVDALGVPRDLKHFPLFQAKLNLQNAPEERGAELPGLRLEPIAGESATAQLALNLRISDGPAGLSFTLEYDADLFDEATADRLLEELAALLALAAARPETPLDELAAALAKAERELQSERDRRIEEADRAGLRAFRKARRTQA